MKGILSENRILCRHSIRCIKKKRMEGNFTQCSQNLKATEAATYVPLEIDLYSLAFQFAY